MTTLSSGIWPRCDELRPSWGGTGCPAIAGFCYTVRTVQVTHPAAWYASEWRREGRTCVLWWHIGLEHHGGTENTENSMTWKWPDPLGLVSSSHNLMLAPGGLPCFIPSLRDDSYFTALHGGHHLAAGQRGFRAGGLMDVYVPLGRRDGGRIDHHLRDCDAQRVRLQVGQHEDDGAMGVA